MIDVPSVRPARWHQFSLVTWLFTCAAIPISVGFVAAIDFVSFQASDELFGLDWMSAVRHKLIDDWGFPSSIVVSYGTFSMVALPKWIALGTITFLLGLARSGPATVLAWSIAVGLPFADAIGDMRSPLLLNTAYVRVVSIIGVPVVLFFWWIGWLIRGRRDHERNDFDSVWLKGMLGLSIVGISGYGWWLLTVPMDP